MDNGKEVTDRLFGLRKRAATGEHEFDTLCTALEIKHRLTPPKSPQTNGMVERFNGLIGGAAKSPLPIRRRAGNNAAQICLALQPAACAISIVKQVALAGDEGLAQTQAGSVQETAILPAGMSQLM